MAGFFCCRMTLPLWYPVGGLAPGVAVSASVNGTLWGACPLYRPPTLPLVCLFAPYPPNPLPRQGRGRFFSLFRRGLRPRHPCIKPFAALIVFATVVPGGGLAPGGTGYPCRCGTRREACLLCRPPTLPLVCCFAPYPPTPFPGGEGGDFLVYFAGGFAPGTPALNRLRHLQSLPLWYPAGGACPGDTGSTCQSGIRQGLAFGIASSPQNRQRHFPMSGAGSQGEGGPGERNFGV